MPTIHTIDLHFLGEPRRIAAFLVLAPNGALLIETGAGSMLPALEAGLAAHGVLLDDIRHALVTHIHLDHAGAAGAFAQRGAMIHAHKFGAKHLVDPSKLIASATRIYGDQMDRLWGTMLPVPAERMHAVCDGETIEACGMSIRAIETPGHARHHHCYALEVDGEVVGFVGDVTAELPRGLTPPSNCGIVNLPTPPPEFDLELWLASINTIEAESFSAICLTHFGRVDDVRSHLESVRRTLRSHSGFVRAALESGLMVSDIVPRYGQFVRDRAVNAGLDPNEVGKWAADAKLAADVTGMVRYWRSRGI